jgi:hypothetical protein
MGYQRWRSNWLADPLGGPTPHGGFFQHVEDALEEHATLVAGALTVLVYSGGTYPPRPAVPAGQVRYVDTSGWWVNTDSSDFTHPWGYAHQQLARLTGSALRGVLARGGTYVNIGGGAKLVSPVRL